MKRACTEEQVLERKKEIIKAVNKMFDTMDYQDISMKTISENISIARSSLYFYYSSKEEIMLDIIKNEYIKFINELIASFNNDNSSIDKLSNDLTNCYLNHIRLLKIISIYLVDIEIHSSLDKLIEFKSNFINLFDNLKSAINNRFKNSPEFNISNLFNSLLMLTHGLYPLINPLEKQTQAMKAVGMNTNCDKQSYTKNYLLFILKNM